MDTSNNKYLWATPPRMVALVAFIFSAAVTAVITVMPFFVLNQLNGGAMMMGLFSGVSAAGYALASLVSSRFVARAQNGLVWAIIGSFGFMAFVCAMPAFRNPWICGACFACAFIMTALAWPAFHSYVGAEHHLEKRARNMGLLNIGWSVGGAAGPFLAGPLYVMDYRLPFIFVFVLCMAVVIILYFIPDEHSYFGEAAAEMLHLRAAHDKASEAFLVIAWCATFASHICVGSTRAIFPKRLDDIIAAGDLRLLFETEPLTFLNTAAATRFSWLAVALGLATGIIFLLLGRSGWWHHRFSVLVAIQVLTAAAMWTLGYTHSLIVMAVCFAVIGANLGIAFFSSGFYGMANPMRKHSRAAINEGVVGMGGLVGGIGFALVAERFGIEAPFYGMPVVMTGIIAIQFLLIQRNRMRAG
jgi:MFS family permease